MVLYKIKYKIYSTGVTNSMTLHTENTAGVMIWIRCIDYTSGLKCWGCSSEVLGDVDTQKLELVTTSPQWALWSSWCWEPGCGRRNTPPGAGPSPCRPIHCCWGGHPKRCCLQTWKWYCHRVQVCSGRGRGSRGEGSAHGPGGTPVFRVRAARACSLTCFNPAQFSTHVGGGEWEGLLVPRSTWHMAATWLTLSKRA